MRENFVKLNLNVRKMQTTVFRVNQFCLKNSPNKIEEKNKEYCNILQGTER